MDCTYEGQCGMLQVCNIDGVCEHDLIFPISVYTGCVYAIIPFVLGIGMLGGLGGGVLKGPILMMMLNYSLFDATNVSYCIMFGGCLVNAAQVIFIKHPVHPGRPIINFDLAMIQNCTLSVGSNIGSSLSIFLPQFYITIFQEAFLLSIIPYLWVKGQKERKKNWEAKISSDSPIQLKETKKNLVEKVALVQKESIVESENGRELETQFERNQKQILPVVPCLIIVAFFIQTQIFTTLIPAFVKTPKDFPECFSVKNLLLVILTVINPFQSYFVYRYGKKQEEIKMLNNIYHEKEIFKPTVFLWLYFAGFLAGFVSGMVGLGAGLILVPVMLNFGVHPRVASSTSAFNFFFIAVTNLFTLLDEKLLPPQVIYWFSGLAFIGGSVITKIGYMIMEKYKLSYAVILIVISLSVGNLIAGIWYVTVETERFGFDSLLHNNAGC